jgi:hypothetical protein
MPAVRHLGASIDFVLEAASYADKAFVLFDEKTSNTTKPLSAYEQLRQGLNQFGNSLPKLADTDQQI